MEQMLDVGSFYAVVVLGGKHERVNQGVFFYGLCLIIFSFFS
jgi:hypothetical protein